MVELEQMTSSLNHPLSGYHVAFVVHKMQLVGGDVSAVRMSHDEVAAARDSYLKERWEDAAPTFDHWVAADFLGWLDVDGYRMTPFTTDSLASTFHIEGFSGVMFYEAFHWSVLLNMAAGQFLIYDPTAVPCLFRLEIQDFVERIGPRIEHLLVPSPPLLVDDEEELER